MATDRNKSRFQFIQHFLRLQHNLFVGQTWHPWHGVPGVPV